MAWTIEQIERTFLSYMERHGHAVIEEHSVRSPTDDVLFTTAGMHPLVPYLKGEQTHPAGRRLTDVQRCVRTTDIDEVGDNRHLTVFEMLGNWSLGDYFKETSIPQSFGLLTGEFGIDPHSLNVTVFAGDAEVPADDESPEIWAQTFRDAGVDPAGRIHPLGEDDNWWSNGPVGLCGPDTEIFVYVGDRPDGEREPFGDIPEYVEIWNNVFMTYNRSRDGELTVLSQRNVDTGMGLERLALFLNDHDSVWQTDELHELTVDVADALGVGPDEPGDRQRSLFIVTDHLRAALCIAAAGIQPSASRQGYILRKLIRRAVRHGELLRGTDQDLAPTLIEATDRVSRVMGRRWPDVGPGPGGDAAKATIDKEAGKFAKTLRNGVERLQQDADAEHTFDGDLAFLLADTLGYPVELSAEEAQRIGMPIADGWQDRYEQLREEQRNRSHAHDQRPPVSAGVADDRSRPLCEISDMTAAASAPAAEAAAPVDGPATGTPRWSAKAADIVRRYWATSLIVAIVLVAGVATGALWHGVNEGDALYGHVAYGLPVLQDGRWWTFLTGMFFAPQVVLYLPILALLVAVASVYERRVGHVRTLVVAIGGQFLGALITALFLWPFDGTGWTWADQLGNQLDLGISAGGFATMGALSAVMQPVWRNRIRIGFGAYLGAMVLNSGLLWDVEHFVAFVLGVVAGPFLAGRLPAKPQLRFGRRTQRTAVALVVALSAITALIEGLYPGNGGPFHAGNQPTGSTGVTLGLVVSAVLLLAAADGLRRGRRFAWVYTTVLLALAFVAVLTAPHSAERTADLVLVGGQLLLLVVTFRAFTAVLHRRSFRHVGRRLLWVAIGLFVYTAVGFAVLQDDFQPAARPADMITEFLYRMVFSTSGNIEPVTTSAKWFINSIGAIWIGVIVISLIGLLYSSRRPRQEPDADVRLRGLLRRHHSSNIEWMLTWKGITVWFSDDGQTAIGYEVVGSVALCLADPVGPLDRRQTALREFDGYCFARGWVPCLFAAGQETADLAPGLGWKAVEVAEDSVMPLEHLEFKGKVFQDVRTAINKAGKQDVTLAALTWREATPVVTDQLRAISGGWVSDKALPEMGFTLGTLREAEDPEVRLHLAVDADRTIEGFTSWMPVSEDDKVVGWTLDLMRRRDHGFRPVMEFLIGASAMQFKEEGYRFVSLSAAPLAKAPDELGGNSDQQVLQKLLDFLGRTLEPYYGFQSLFAFKQKFKPEHRPMYLVFPDETALGEIGIAVARAYMPDAGLWDWVKMTWDMLRPHRTVEPHED